MQSHGSAGGGGAPPANHHDHHCGDSGSSSANYPTSQPMPPFSNGGDDMTVVTSEGEPMGKGGGRLGNHSSAPSHSQHHMHARMPPGGHPGMSGHHHGPPGPRPPHMVFGPGGGMHPMHGHPSSHVGPGHDYPGGGGPPPYGPSMGGHGRMPSQQSAYYKQSPPAGHPSSVQPHYGADGPGPGPMQMRGGGPPPDSAPNRDGPSEQGQGQPGPGQNNMYAPMPGRLLGIRQCVMRLITYSIHQRRRPKDNNMDFWRMFAVDYFFEKATIRFDFMNVNTGEPRCFEPCMEVLPRLFKVRYDSGVKEEFLHLADPCEYLLEQGMYLVDCPHTTIVSIFDDCQVCIYGHLRVCFLSNLKILCWEFLTSSHTEFISAKEMHRYKSNLQAQQAGGRGADRREMRKSPVNEYGLTDLTFRTLEIAECLNKIMRAPGGGSWAQAQAQGMPPRGPPGQGPSSRMMIHGGQQMGPGHPANPQPGHRMVMQQHPPESGPHPHDESPVGMSPGTPDPGQAMYGGDGRQKRPRAGTQARGAVVARKRKVNEGEQDEKDEKESEQGPGLGGLSHPDGGEDPCGSAIAVDDNQVPAPGDHSEMRVSGDEASPPPN